MRVIDEHGVPKLDDILGVLDTMAYNAQYDLDLTDATQIVLKPNGSGIYQEDMPVIYGTYQHDDEYFWFDPRMEFPKELNDTEYRGTYQSHMKEWEKAAKLADYLLEVQWRLDDEYED